MIYLFAIAFSAGWAVGFQVYISEIQPAKTRASASSLSRSSNWVSLVLLLHQSWVHSLTAVAGELDRGFHHAHLFRTFFLRSLFSFWALVAFSGRRFHPVHAGDPRKIPGRN